MKHRFISHLTALAAAALLLWGPSQAFAGGTASGTDVSNTATLDYTVNSISQDQKTSNTVTFKVDKKVDLIVSESDSALLQVTPGATNQVLTFSVTNTGNDTQDIALSPSALSDGTADPFGSALTDTFDATLVGVFVEDGTTGGYQPAEDTATYLDELSPDVAKTVYIVTDIPSSQVDEDLAVYALLGEVRAGGAAGSLGAALSQTDSGSVSDGAVDILFADGIGTDDDQTNPDAKHSDRSAYLVVSADMLVTKSQSIDDGSGNSYAIPGAAVTYQILIENNGSATASGITVIDEIPANTSFVVGSTTGGTAAYTTDSDGTVDSTSDWAYTPSADADGLDTTVTGIKFSTSDIAAGSSATVTFQVQIN